jgi:hypothetical protein
MDQYSPYNKGKRARKSRQVWHNFQSCFGGFFLLQQGRTIDCGHIFQGANLWVGRTIV